MNQCERKKVDYMRDEHTDTQSHTVNIVKVPFYGDQIDALQEGRDVWVSLKRMCENVSLDPDTQRKKLISKAWATTVIKTVVAEDGKSREMLMLHLDSVPMWFATIDPNRVREEVRPKLINYQRECAKVLRDHFFGPPHDIDLRDIVKEVSHALVPVIVQAVTEVAKQEREFAIQERTTIGRSGATKINRDLRSIARLIAGDDKSAYRSALSAAHMDLRSHLNFSGTGRGWGNLPLSKWPDAKAELERMMKTAVRAARSRQEQGTLFEVK